MNRTPERSGEWGGAEGRGSHVQGREEQDWLDSDRGEALQVHTSIPLGYDLAMAMNHGPVTLSMGLVHPLCSLPFCGETQTFFSCLKGSLLDFSLQPGVNPRQAVPISCGYSGGRVLGGYQRPGGSSQLPPAWTAGVPPTLPLGPASPSFAQDGSQAAGEFRGQPPHPSSFPPPQSLALLCVRKAGTPLSGAPDPPAGKKKDNLEISLKKERLIWYVFLQTPTYHNSG